MVRRPNWLGGMLIAIAVIAVAACASIMGVEDARLDDATTTPEAGTSTSSSSGQPPDDSGAAGDAAPLCAGKDCACTRASDCIDPIFKACERGLCRECSLSPDDCPADQYCQASTLQCVPGCKGNAACEGSAPATKCDPVKHRCVECLGQSDCPGEFCTPAGTCGATGCDLSPGKCAGDEQCCSDICVKKLDPNNCNSCGNACSGGANAQCCPGSGCSDTSKDPAHCGSCTKACATTSATTTSCVASACEWKCQPGFGHCRTGNTACETNINSPTVCGACATNCTTQVKNATNPKCGASGSAFRCNFDACNSGFADTDTNRANGCETACGASGGACCPGGGSAACALATDRCIAGSCQPCIGNDARCGSDGDCCAGKCDTPPGKCR